MKSTVIVGSAGHRGDGDVRAVKAGMAAWEKFRQSKRCTTPQQAAGN